MPAKTKTDTATEAKQADTADEAVQPAWPDEIVRMQTAWPEMISSRNQKYLTDAAAGVRAFLARQGELALEAGAQSAAVVLVGGDGALTFIESEDFKVISNAVELQKAIDAAVSAEFAEGEAQG